MNRKFGAVAALAAGMIVFAGVAGAAEVDVKMLNRGAAGPMVFEPAMVKIAPGDTVHFIAADKGDDVLSVDGMIPDGAQPFEGKLSQDLTVTFTVPGAMASSASRLRHGHGGRDRRRRSGQSRRGQDGETGRQGEEGLR